jgi:hypothetical protein
MCLVNILVLIGYFLPNSPIRCSLVCFDPILANMVYYIVYYVYCILEEPNSVF